MRLHFVLLSLSLAQCQALNVLLYQATFGHSHVNFVAKIADALANAGHSVFLLQPIMNPTIGPGTNKAEVLRIEPTTEVHEALNLVKQHGKGRWGMTYFRFINMIMLMKQFALVNQAVCRSVISNTTVMAELKSRKFDIAMTQPFDTCGLGLFHLLGIEKFNLLLSVPLIGSYAHVLGIPSGLSFIPALYSSNVEQMNVWERTMNLFAHIGELYSTYRMLAEDDELIREVDPAYMGGMAKLQEASFVMPNSEPLFDFPRPASAKVVHIGGISVPSPSTALITDELSALLNARPHTVFVSFGSMARAVDMPHEYKRGLVEAMRRFKRVTFIWKYEEPENASVTQGAENIALVKWAPQADLLCDARLTAFITHGGAGSINELVLRGKKAIAIPQFGDQAYNARMAARFGSIKVLPKDILANAEALAHEIDYLINNEEMDEAAERLSRMIAERPFTPQEQLVRHTEFAAMYGPLKNLDPHSRQLSLVAYFMLDIAVTLLGSLFLVAFALAYAGRKYLQSQA